MNIIKYHVPYPYQSIQYVKRILKSNEHSFRTHLFISSVRHVEHAANALLYIRERLLETLKCFLCQGVSWWVRECWKKRQSAQDLDLLFLQQVGIYNFSNYFYGAGVGVGEGSNIK